MTALTVLAVYVLGACIYAFLMAFIWPPVLEYDTPTLKMWDSLSTMRIGFGTVLWPVACLAVLPILAFKYGTYRREKVLNEGD